MDNYLDRCFECYGCKTNQSERMRLFTAYANGMPLEEAIATADAVSAYHVCTARMHEVVTTIGQRQYRCLIGSLNVALCAAYVGARDWMDRPRQDGADWSIAIDGHVIASGDSRGGWFSWDWPGTV